MISSPALAGIGHDDAFYVLVPRIRPEFEASWMPTDAAFGMPVAPSAGQDAIEEARERSERLLELVIDKIHTLGGEVGDTEPMTAVKDVLDRHTFHEVIVSVLPATLSRWLKMDLPSRISRHVEVPVTTVEAEE